MMFAAPERTAERKAFYQRIDRENLTPLWEVLGELVPPRPRTPCVPALWRYDTVRAHRHWLTGKTDDQLMFA